MALAGATSNAALHWTVSGADAIIVLRCKEASSTREAICDTPHAQTRTAPDQDQPEDDLDYRQNCRAPIRGACHALV
jgi:hypothetical protein